MSFSAYSRGSIYRCRFTDVFEPFIYSRVRVAVYIFHLLVARMLYRRIVLPTVLVRSRFRTLLN